MNQDHIGIEWNRTFYFKGNKRFFDAIMVYDEKEDRILDFFGKPHLLLSVLAFEASPDGSLTITSGKQWLLLCGKRIPAPKWLTGTSVVCETFDESKNCFTIQVHVQNTILGILFFYKGTFQEEERIMLKRNGMISTLCFIGFFALEAPIYQWQRHLFCYPFFILYREFFLLSFINRRSGSLNL